MPSHFWQHIQETVRTSFASCELLIIIRLLPQTVARALLPARLSSVRAKVAASGASSEIAHKTIKMDGIETFVVLNE